MWVADFGRPVGRLRSSKPTVKWSTSVAANLPLLRALLTGSLALLGQRRVPLEAERIRVHEVDDLVGLFAFSQCQNVSCLVHVISPSTDRNAGSGN
jgi:hypothetical protein